MIIAEMNIMRCTTNYLDDTYLGLTDPKWSSLKHDKRIVTNKQIRFLRKEKIETLIKELVPAGRFPAGPRLIFGHPFCRDDMACIGPPDEGFTSF